MLCESPLGTLSAEESCEWERSMIPRPPLHRITRTADFHLIDGSGTIFVARAFELAHACLVEFLATQQLGLERMLRSEVAPMPIVQAQCDFHAPLRAGETVGVELRCEKVGDTSITLEFTARVDGAPRFTVRQVHVTIDPTTGRPITVPDAIRQAFASPRATV